MPAMSFIQFLNQQLKRRSTSNFITYSTLLNNLKKRRNFQIFNKYPNVAQLNRVSLFFVQSFITFSFIKTNPAKQADTPANNKMTEKLDEMLQHADQLFDENHHQDAIDLLKTFPDQNIYEIKWRLARALYCYAKTFPNIREAGNFVREAYSYADEAVKLNDNHFAGHKWMSVLLDSKSGLEGLRERVAQLHNVKYHMEKAVELNPDDATSWYILGEFAYGLADLPWYSRTAMTTVLANPPTGTYEEALEYFSKAETVRPKFYSMNLLMLGKCYYNLKNIEKAKEYLELASEINVVNEDDKKCKEEALKLLKKI